MQRSDTGAAIDTTRAVLVDMRMQSEGATAHTRLWFACDGSTLEAVALGHEGPWLGIMLSNLSVDTISLLQLPGQQVPLVTGCDRGAARGVLGHIPVSSCPKPGCIAGIRGLVQRIDALPLRDFVETVFAERSVHDHFWTKPASLRHHHAFPGGLALHTLEVATDMAEQRALTGTERDIGIAAALLHDIGKVWSYDARGRLTRAGEAMGHELLGLSRLRRALDSLEWQWPDAACALHVLLCGQAHRRADGSMPYALAQRIRACDQRSVERAGRHPNWRGGRAWTPAPYGATGVA